jgi:hypothetical protein
MTRFALLAYASVGHLFNEDFALPENVYAGFGTDCQLMTTANAALLQPAMKSGHDLEMMNAIYMADHASRVPCPK